MSQPLTATYRPDLAGLICAYLFHPERGSRALAPEEVEAWVQPPPAEGDEFIWLHMSLAHAGTEKWLHRHLALSPVFFDALREGTRSTRIDYADNSLVAVVNDVLFDFSYDASEISTLWVSVAPRVLVTARSKPLRSVDRLREAVKRGEETLRSPAELLIHLLRDEADVLIQIVRDLAAKVDSIEDRLLVSRRLDDSRAQLGAYRRLLVRLQRLLAPEPSALFRLLTRPPKWIAAVDVSDLRQSTEEFSTVISDMTVLQERIKLLQEEIAAEITEQTNRSLFVLTTVSVVALPINLISGLFGMNVGGIPLAHDGAGFWIVVTLVASLTALAAMLAFRSRADSQD